MNCTSGEAIACAPMTANAFFIRARVRKRDGLFEPIAERPFAVHAFARLQGRRDDFLVV